MEKTRWTAPKQTPPFKEKTTGKNLPFLIGLQSCLLVVSIHGIS